MGLSESRDGEQVYAEIAATGPISLDRLSSVMASTKHDLQSAVAALTELGLVRVDADGLVALPPSLVLSNHAETHRREWMRLRDIASRYSAVYDRGSNPLSIEVLTSAEAISSAYRSLAESAEAEVCALHLGIVAGQDRQDGLVNDGFVKAVSRGVRFRVVYDHQVLQTPVGREIVQRSIELGEEARVYRGVPMTMLIGDQPQGMILVPAATDHRLVGVTVPGSSLLRSLSAVFEFFWQAAVPLPRQLDRYDADEPGAVSDVEQRIISSLAAGLTDDRIANELDISQRTVRRYIARIERRFGAVSRFQLGMQIMRTGMFTQAIPPPAPAPGEQLRP
ncbi:helix-turn-helix transcriptional regulator [Kribbella sp. NPDC056861]|uniref:helix-turn-helix transcriptional regulator n=1 Tax=Kribbella sp. NPDC056861 TaxID=3154857 RepID=UPI00341969A7